MRITVVKTTKRFEVWYLEAPDAEAALAQVQSDTGREADQVFSHPAVFDTRQDENEPPGPRPLLPWDERAKGAPR